VLLKARQCERNAKKIAQNVAKRKRIKILVEDRKVDFVFQYAETSTVLVLYTLIR